MKKLAFLIYGLTLSILAFPFSALAQNLGNAFELSKVSAEKAGYNSGQSLESTASQIITFVLSLLGAIFIGFIIYGGIVWMTANGNEQKAEKAGKIIKESFLGLTVVILAYAVSFFFFKFFGSQLAGGQ